MTKKETLIMDPIHGFINISEYSAIEELVESKPIMILEGMEEIQ